jgi:5,5'-dehydrodivanillate O-demethylase
LLHTGWVEQENIRCMYHGWMYNGRGQCMEQPAEDPSFPPKIQIVSYPARDYAGLVYISMNEGGPPDFALPRHEELERRDGVRWIQKQVWPCNWFQSIENSLDAVHVSFVHLWGKVGPFGAAVTDLVPKLEYAETESGIRQVARRSETNVRVSDWTFPNHNHIIVPGLHPQDPWTHTFPWMVPMDEAHMFRVIQQFSPVKGEEARRLKEYLLSHGFEPTEEPDLFYGRGAYDPAQHHDELFYQRLCPEPHTNELTHAQDYVAQVGQGSIVDRGREHLGQSDAGIILQRKLFLRELTALRDGRPLKQWKRGAEPLELPTQPGETPSRQPGWDRLGVTRVVPM